MGDLLGTVGAAIGLFVGTDVDDLIVLTVLFLAARAAGTAGTAGASQADGADGVDRAANADRAASRTLRPWQIWVGQYAGIAVLMAVSALAALGLTLVPDRWVGLLGLVPLGMGLYGLVGASRRDDGEQAPPVAAGALSVAGVTIANGADNIAVYTPMFRTIGLDDSAIVVAVFAVMVALWCAAASWLGSHRAVIALVGRWGHWIVPVVFIVLGGWILSGLL